MARFLCCLGISILASGNTASADWGLQWSISLPARQSAWEFTPKMPRDVAYQPVAAGDLVLIGCEHDGALLAADGKTNFIGDRLVLQRISESGAKQEQHRMKKKRAGSKSAGPLKSIGNKSGQT